MVMGRLAFYRKVAEFAGARLSQYIELGLIEISLYRAAIVRSIVAYIVMAFCGLFALAFLSIAIIVTYWETDARVQATWWVFGTWCALAIASFLIARTAAPDDAPASTISNQLNKDLAAIKGDHDE